MSTYISWREAPMKSITSEAVATSNLAILYFPELR
jgi:hypothetical protein